MRLRKLALAVGLAGTMGAQMASALGLGEIKLHSKLNEPLNAEIRLLQVKDLSKNEVLVELASNDDFKRAGIDRVFFLTDLRFEVVLDAPAGPVVRVTSQKPVKEPYLNFLLESQWPNGRILREYTLLMDLPTFAEQRPGPVQSASTSIPSPSATVTRAGSAAPATAAQGAAQTATSTPAARTPAAPAPSYQGEVYGPVGANDTLWEIALKVRPNRQYSVQQTMLALQQLNPDAFINGNINLLREGQVLRVPASSDIDNIGAQQAVSEVAQQNSAWSELRGVATGPQLEGSKRARPASTGTDSGISGRLTVGGAGAAESGQSGRASGGDSAALQGELASSLEKLDSARRENTELKDRVAEMEEQIQTMERLLEVSSEEFRALQQNIAARNAGQDADSDESAGRGQELSAAEAVDAASMSDAATAADVSSAGDTEPVDGDSVVAAESAAQAPVVQAPSAQPEVKVRDTSRVVQSAPAKKPSFLDLVLDNILYVGAGILAILLAIVFFLRRRKSEDEPQEQADEVAVMPVAAAAAAATTTADIDAAIESGVADDFSLAYDDVDLAAEDDLFAEEEASIEPQTGDAVAEADIYISYGKLEQAEDLLHKALEQEPGLTDARLKLLEVHASGQNLDKFDQQMGEIVASGDAVAIERAERLRQQFADAPAYQHTDDAAENEFALGDDALDLDFDLGDDSLSAGQTEKPGSTDTPEFELGEDFGLRFAASLTSASDERDAAESDEEGLSLELDEAMLAAEDDFLADLDSSFAELDSNEELTFDLAEGDEPLTLDLDLSELDAAEDALTEAPANEALTVTPVDDAGDEELEELDLDALADGDDAFDLNMDDMDLAALDEEFSALSENIDFAGEEFGFNEESDLESSVTLEDIQPAADTDSVADAADLGELDLGELDLTLDDADDEISLDTLELDDLSFDGDDLAPEKGDLSLDLDDDFSADFAAGLEEDEVPTLSLENSESLDNAETEPSAEVTEPSAEEPAELELDEADFAAFDTSDFEEFDLAADLGLDESDFATSEDDLAEDELFSEALSQLPTPEDVMAEDVNEDDFDAELDFLADTDEAATKLDLARAYIDMGDQEGAKDILSEVVVEGNDAQKLEAEELLTRLS